MDYFYVDILTELHCVKFCTEINVSHRLTPYCIFSENLVEIFKIYKIFGDIQRNLEELTRFSEEHYKIPFSFRHRGRKSFKLTIALYWYQA